MPSVDSFLDGAEGSGQKVKLARTTISLPASLLESVEDQARDNKRRNMPDTSVSAICKRALEAHMKIY